MRPNTSTYTTSNKNMMDTVSGKSKDAHRHNMWHRCGTCMMVKRKERSESKVQRSNTRHLSHPTLTCNLIFTSLLLYRLPQLLHFAQTSSFTLFLLLLNYPPLLSSRQPLTTEPATALLTLLQPLLSEEIDTLSTQLSRAIELTVSSERLWNHLQSIFATPRSEFCMTTATNSAQPRTPRARHRHNKSTAQDADNVASGGNGQSRNNNQRRNNNQQSQQTAPAWEETVIQNDMGDFDANGNFVSVDSMASGKKPGNRRQQKPRKDVQHEYATTSQSPLQVHAGNTINHIAQPQPIKPDTPAKSIAYAGPTFHASPAPSALPMPKFFSKSVPAASQQSGLQARLDQETQQSPAPTKQLTPPRAVPVLHEPACDTASPLDMFFKADREERAKQSHANAQTSTPPSKPALPVPQTEPAPNSYWSQIYGQGQKRHSRHASNSSGRDMFMMELDGPLGPQRPGPSPHSPRGESSRSATSPSAIPQYQSIAPPSNTSGRAAPTPSHASQVNNVVPMTAPHDSRFNNGAHSAAHEASPFYRPDMQQQYPRSAGNTPVPQHNGSVPNAQDQQHLHYGNKNLSPLFKAARMAPGYADSPAIRRTSSLRQEVGADDGAPLQNGRAQHESGYSSSDQNITSSNDILGRLRALQPQQSQPKVHSSQQTHHTPYQQARPTSSGNPAHDAAALNYLQHSINQQPYSQGPPIQQFSQHMHHQNHHSSAPQFQQYASPSPKPANVASMEADLKRMLNLGGAPLE